MLTYRTYLRLPELLDLQTPVGSASSSDERLFIVIHQICELWFKLLLDALEETRDKLLAGELPAASRRLARVISLQRLLITQVELVETMSLAEFAAFRGELGSASGFESAQYQEVECLAGAKNPEYLRQAYWLSDDERARLSRRLAEPSVWDGYLTALRSHDLPADSPEQIIASLCAAAADERAYGGLWMVAEDLRTYDALAGAWRLRHAQLAERYIGAAKGTGGSRGAAYLHGQVDRRYYPLLWHLNLETDDVLVASVPDSGRALSPGTSPPHCARPAARPGTLRRRPRAVRRTVATARGRVRRLAARRVLAQALPA